MTDESTLRWTYRIVGLLLLVWGVVQFAFGARDRCAIYVEALTLFRTGGAASPATGLAAAVVDPLNAGVSTTLLVSIASFVEGLYLLALGLFDGPWSTVYEEAMMRKSMHRWIRYGLVDALYFVAIYAVVGVQEVFLLVSVVPVVIGLNFIQAYNESYYAAYLKADGEENRELLATSDKLEPTYPVWHAWILAFAIAAYQFIVWWVYSLSGNAPLQAEGIFAIPYVWSIAYVLLHVFILLFLTNAKMWDSVWGADREYVFIVMRMIGVLYLTIALFAGNIQDADGCLLK